MRILAVLTALILTACGPAPIVNPELPEAPPTATLVHHEPDGCGMAGLQGLVGHPATDVPRAIAAQSRPIRHRVLPFGSMIAQDYDAGRVNVLLDAAGLVSAVRCG